MARLLFILLLCYYSQAFNLDTRTPVVKFGGAYSDSYFGFSVAQHKTGEGEPVILVGAPKDKNLQPGTEKSGALYKCGLSLYTRDCVQVETDGRRHDSGRLYGIYDGNITSLKPPVSSELKEDQWLGVSLDSQGEGGKVIVCAHRYSVRDVHKVTREPIDSKRAMLGMCYILNDDLTLPQDTSIGAKNVLVVREALRGKRLEVMNDFDNHAKFGVCQVGTSAAWVRSTSLREQNYALFGAPGCFTWRGNVLGQKTGTTGSYESAVRDDNNLRFTKHGHLGLSVTSGNYFNGQLHYASGAPHMSESGLGTGQIYFFKPNTVSSTLDVEPARTLTGGTFGAGYGSSLETLDVNGDGLDDLLVGAPFTENGGCVFLYINTGDGLRNGSYIELRGTRLESQFGLSLTRLADINHDGYDDFAVGAPYEDGGAVYIFLGAPSGISGVKQGKTAVSAKEVASQIITAEQMVNTGGVPTPDNFKTFGSSLAGGLDLDNNNYPDLLIGSFSSNCVHLLLARPIINITTRVEDTMLKTIDPGTSGCPRDPDSPYTCFHFSACFRLESQQDSMMIRFKIVAEPSKSVSRVWLRLDEDPDHGNRNNTVQHNLLIQCTPHCRNSKLSDEMEVDQGSTLDYLRWHSWS